MQNIRRSAYLLNAVLAAACVFSIAWKPAPPPVFRGAGPDDVPTRVSGGRYVSTGDVTLAPEVQAALSAGTVVYRTFADTGAKAAEDTDSTLDFVLIGGTDRSALHDPRSCLAGAGWQMSGDHTVTLPGTGVTARSCRVERESSSDTGSREGYEIVYLYVVDGQVVPDVTRIRREMLLSAMIGKPNRPVYFFRCIRPLPADLKSPADDPALHEFAAAMWKSLHVRLGVR